MFMHKEVDNPIRLHKPHPKPILKEYVIKQVIEETKKENFYIIMGTLKYKNFIGSVEYSETDKILFGKVLGIRGLISYEAKRGRTRARF